MMTSAVRSSTTDKSDPTAAYCCCWRPGERSKSWEDGLTADATPPPRRQANPIGTKARIGDHDKFSAGPLPCSFFVPIGLDVAWRPILRIASLRLTHQHF